MNCFTNLEFRAAEVVALRSMAEGRALDTVLRSMTEGRVLVTVDRLMPGRVVPVVIRPTMDLGLTGNI